MLLSDKIVKEVHVAIGTGRKADGDQFSRQLTQVYGVRSTDRKPDRRIEPRIILRKRTTRRIWVGLGGGHFSLILPLQP